jgi:effector-binding domain-containing protein
MTVFIIILIIATIGVAYVTFSESLAKNKLIKYGSYIVYFLLIELILYAITGSIDVPLIILGISVAVGLLILIIKFSFNLSTNKKSIKYILSFLFLGIALYSGYLLYESIMTPIRFNAEKNKRYQKTVEELKRIRTAQIAFKNEYDKYTKSLDTLKKFIINDSMTVIKRVGEAPDSIYLQQNNNLEKAEKLAWKLGLIIRDTFKVSILDTLFNNYDLKKFGYVPFTDNYKFEMDTASIATGGLNINVFEARVLYSVLLNGMDKHLIGNLNDDAQKLKLYPGLRVGSLKENNNNEGNWNKEYDIK